MGEKSPQDTEPQQSTHPLLNSQHQGRVAHWGLARAAKAVGQDLAGQME